MRKLIYILYIVAAMLFVASVACQGSTRDGAAGNDCGAMPTCGATEEDAHHVAATATAAHDIPDGRGHEAVAEKVHYMPGDTVPEEVVKAYGMTTFFSERALSDSVFAVMKGKSYGKGCTVPRKALRYLTCLHITNDGYTVMGEMVLNASISKKVLDILRQLYEAHYPIERMRLVDNYNADDQVSMTANNSTGFNFRFVSGTQKVSKHGMGLAVDINPLYNPCRRTTRSGEVKIEPVAGKAYANRDADFVYKMTRNDLCCRLFREAGFRWGGDWRTVKDYQHFEMP